MAVLINEILPNPEGDDKAGEFIEIFNSGKEGVVLDGLKLKDKSEKSFDLTGRKIEAGGYLVFEYKEIGITINNSDEIIFLNEGKRVLDKAEIKGTASEGKSFSRNGGKFLWTSKITKGEKNIFDEAQVSNYAEEKVFQGRAEGDLEVKDIFSALSLGILMGMFAIYCYKLIFSENEEESKEGYSEWRGGTDEFCL